jgi:hypothetical protein
MKAGTSIMKRGTGGAASSDRSSAFAGHVDQHQRHGRAWAARAATGCARRERTARASSLQQLRAVDLASGREGKTVSRVATTERWRSITGL